MLFGLSGSSDLSRSPLTAHSGTLIPRSLAGDMCRAASLSVSLPLSHLLL